MIWTTEYLDRLALEAETEIARETLSIIDRISLQVNLNQAEFLLPEYVFNVKSVYWKGERLTPISALTISQTGYDIMVWSDGAFEGSAFSDAYLIGSSSTESSLGSGISSGKPVEYFYSKFGENIIRINPSGNEALAKFENGLWHEDNLRQSLVVEFYRFPDGINWKIPEYIRRRTIKAYVLWKAFLKDGDGQNLKAAQYFAQRYALLLGRAKKIIDRINIAYIPIAPSNLHYSEFSQDYGYQGLGRMPRPVLPSNYGIQVEDLN